MPGITRRHERLLKLRAVGCMLLLDGAGEPNNRLITAYGRARKCEASEGHNVTLHHLPSIDSDISFRFITGHISRLASSRMEHPSPESNHG